MRLTVSKYFQSEIKKSLLKATGEDLCRRCCVCFLFVVVSLLCVFEQACLVLVKEMSKHLKTANYNASKNFHSIKSIFFCMFIYFINNRYRLEVYVKLRYENQHIKFFLHLIFYKNYAHLLFCNLFLKVNS